MGENSKIEWTDHTFNPWIGCTKVAAGCKNRYAENLMDSRYGKAQWGPNGTRVLTSPANWRKPISWNKAAQAEGVRRRVFCASLADVFEDWKGRIVGSGGHTIHNGKEWGSPSDLIEVPGTLIGHSVATLGDVRRKLFGLIDATPWLDWLLLTKRPENVRQMWPEKTCERCDGHRVIGSTTDSSRDCPDCGGQDHEHRSNVWLGTSVATQEDAFRNLPELLKCREYVPVLFVSAEPLLGPVDLIDAILRVRRTLISKPALSVFS